MTNEEERKLCEKHWEYIAFVIIKEHEVNGIEEDELTLSFNDYISRIKFHYLSAMLHGIKHGREIHQKWIKDNSAPLIDARDVDYKKNRRHMQNMWLSYGKRRKETN